MLYLVGLVLFLPSFLITAGLGTQAHISVRVEKDQSVSLVLNRVSTGQVIEWQTSCKAGVPSADRDKSPIPITAARVDTDGRYVVFQTAQRLSPVDGGTPPFVYALDFRNPTAPVRRFLGQGASPHISSDGERICFTRIVNGGPATVSLNTRDWELEVSASRVVSTAEPGSASPSAHRQLIVPLLPVGQSHNQDRIIFCNPNSESTIVTAQLQHGFLTWRRSFILPARGTLMVDPSELRRGSQAILVDLSSSLPITAEYRIEEMRSGRAGWLTVPALIPDAVGSSLMFSSPGNRPHAAGILILANTGERPTQLRLSTVDESGSEQDGLVQIVTVEARDLSLIPLAPLAGRRIHVDALDQGQVAGTLVVMDAS